MDAETITSLISTVGFPIVACIYMAVTVNDMNTKHKEEMDSMRDALNANTNAIDKLETLINQLLIKMNITSGKGE